MLEEVDRDAKLLKRCEEKRKEWAKHWQCNTEVQDLEDKPWMNEKLRTLEEGLPRLGRKNGEGSMELQAHYRRRLCRETRGLILDLAESSDEESSDEAEPGRA